MNLPITSIDELIAALDLDEKSFYYELREILELKLISKYYFLKNADEFAAKIMAKNKLDGLGIDSNYLKQRWYKLYAGKQNQNFDTKTKEAIIKRDGVRCSYCNLMKNLEVHHVIPQKLNGSNSYFNLVCVCSGCNKDISANIVLPNNWWFLHPESRNKPPIT